MRKHLSYLLIALFSLFTCPAFADLGISLDMDPLTPGIQATHAVDVLDNFDVDVYLIGDGTTMFTALGLSLSFNETGNTISRSANNTFDRLGNGLSLATPVINNIEVGPALSAITANGPIAPFPVGVSGPFLNSDGGLVLRSAILPFYQFPPPPAPGTLILLETLHFTASEAGMTEIRPDGLLQDDPLNPAAPPAPGGFYFFNGAIPLAQGPVNSGTITVNNLVPEPGTFGLLAMGLGLVWMRRRIRTA